MIVWGGSGDCSFNGAGNDGGRYDQTMIFDSAAYPSEGSRRVVCSCIPSAPGCFERPGSTRMLKSCKGVALRSLLLRAVSLIEICVLVRICRCEDFC